MAKVHGSCDDRFKALQTLLQTSIDEGKDLGASIFVNIDGKDIVNIWGGYADAARTREWEENTIVNIWSSSKTILSLAALICIDRGLLDPYEKVAKYWPEFGVNGKQDIEVRHFLSHASGLSGWAEKVSIEDVCDLDKATALLEQQAPFFTPGSASGYHSLTMGHLVGGLVSRVTGKPFAQFIDEELAQPLGADFQLGAREADWPRVADIIAPPALDLASVAADLKDPTSPMYRTLTNPPMDANVANTPLWRGAQLAAANGHSNAAGVGRIMSAIALGGRVGERQILSPATIDLIFQEQQRGPDLVISQNLRWGIGYALTGRGTVRDWMPEGRVCTWGGWGGSTVVMDLERGVTVAYMMNKMATGVLGDGRMRAYVEAVYAALEG